MIYLDTSFVVPLFREEATSRKVADFISRQAAGTLAASKWASVEFASHVSRDVRMANCLPQRVRAYWRSSMRPSPLLL
jgi:predicted nucleic acid-binding protein